MKLRILKNKKSNQKSPDPNQDPSPNDQYRTQTDQIRSTTKRKNQINPR